MAHILKARVAETSISTGTGDFTLSGAVTAHKTFASRMSVADTTEYVIYAVDANGIPTGEWEEGVGTYSAANTLTRTTVAESSNSDTAVNFGAGSKVIIMTPLSSRVAAILKGGASGEMLVKNGSADFAWAWVTAPTGTNTGDETGARVATLLHAATAKTVLVDADEVGGTDSAASYSLIRTTWANVWAYIKSKADAVYQATLVSGTSIKTVNGSSLLGSGDVTVAASIAPLVVEDANTIAQRNGTTAQTSYIYNTRTDASNYERLRIGWASNVLEVMPEKLGTGTLRNLKLSGYFTILDCAAGGITRLASRGSTFMDLDGGTSVATCNGWTLGGPLNGYEAGSSTGRISTILVNTVRAPQMDLDKDYAALPFVLKGGSATTKSGATNIAGAAASLSGGDGSSTASGAAHGGPLHLFGGAAYGTGAAGTVNLAYTGSAARGAVKCWGPLTLASGFSGAIAAKTAAYTVTNNDGACTADATSGAVPFTLPALSGCTAGQEHQFIKTDSSANAMTVDGSGSDPINGSTSALSTTTQWGAFRLKVNADKSGWLSF